MAKKFSKIFAGGEQKKKLLASSNHGLEDDDDERPERSDTLDGDDGFDFPLEPTTGRDDDFFAKGVATDNNNNNNSFLVDDDHDAFDFPQAGTFPETGGSFAEEEDDALNEEAAGAFAETEAFPASPFEVTPVGESAAAGTAAAPAEMLVDFPSSHKEGGDDEADNNDEEEDQGGSAQKPDGAFFASFSNLKIGGETPVEEEQQQAPADGKHHKKKKRITALFTGRGKDKEAAPAGPVSRCAEIVVDKSKIPTTKIDMELAHGQVVAPPKPEDANDLEPEGEKVEKEKKSGKLDRLKKTLKKKLGSNNKQDASEENKEAEYQVPEINEFVWSRTGSKAKIEIEDDDVGDGDEDNGLADASERNPVEGAPRQRVRHRRRTDPAHSSAQTSGGAEQRRSSRRRGTDPRHSKSDGSGGGRPMGNSSKDGNTGEIRFRRVRTEETTRRRHTTKDSSGTGISPGPRRQSAMPDLKGGSSMDESRQRKKEGGSEVDGSARHRSSGGSSRRHRDSGSGKRQGRKSVALDGTPSSPLGRSKSSDGDGLSSSSHQGLRRTQTDGAAMIGRRAQSTRHLLSSSKETSRPLLSDRDRLRRASSTRILSVNKEETDKKQALGNLFGGGGSSNHDNSNEKEEKEPGPRKLRSGSDGDFIDVLVEEENESDDDDSDEDESSMRDKSMKDRSMKDRSMKGKSMKDRSMKEKSMKDISERRSKGNSATDALSNALSGKSLSKEEVEKLVRAVAHQAKNAANEDDLEAIVMGALGGESTDTFGSEIDSDDDDITVGNDIDASDRKFSTKDIQEKARNYVNVFLSAKAAGAGGDNSKEPPKKQSSTNYMSALVDLGSAHGSSHHAKKEDEEDDKDSAVDEINDKDDNQEGHDVEATSGHSNAKADITAGVAKLASKKVKRHSDAAAMKKNADALKKETSKSDAKARPKLSAADVATKRELVKAAKALAMEKNSVGQATGKVDFADVTSKLEAKAEAKTRSRTRPQVAAAK